MVVSVSVDQYILQAYFLTRRPNSGSDGSGYTNLSLPKPGETGQDKLQEALIQYTDDTARVRIQTNNPTERLGEGEVEAGVPVDDDDDVHDEVGDTESVRVVSPGLRPLEELQHPETDKKVFIKHVVQRSRKFGNSFYVTVAF